MIKIHHPTHLPPTDASGEFERPHYISFQELDMISIISKKASRPYFNSTFMKDIPFSFPAKVEDLNNKNMVFARKKESEKEEGILFIACYVEHSYQWLDFGELCKTFFSDSRERPMTPLTAVLLSLPSNRGKLEYLFGKKLVNKGFTKISDGSEIQYALNISVVQE